MQLPNQQPDALAALASELKTQATVLVNSIDADGEVVRLVSDEDIFAGQDSDRLFLVKSGQVQCKQQGKLVYLAEPGDLIGLFRTHHLAEGLFECEAMVELVPYRFSRLQEHCLQNQDSQQRWTQFLFCLSCYFNQALAHEMPKQFKPATGFLQFERGDVIINQGEQAECVYTLLEGSADVTHDGVKVGEIEADEIFGAMALFTKQPRNATVTATSSCSVLAVRKDEFLDLVSHQPQVCMGLIEEMADKINQLNRQVFTLQQ
jgi:CRP-like cAMP-binding protein